jgi:hypothetical protein
MNDFSSVNTRSNESSKYYLPPIVQLTAKQEDNSDSNTGGMLTKVTVGANADNTFW